MNSKTKTTATKGETRPVLVPKLRFSGFKKPWANDPLAKSLVEHKLKNTAGRDVFSVSMESGIVNQIEHLGRSFAASDTAHYSIGRRYDVVYTKSPLKAFPFGIVKQCKFDGEVALSPLYGVFTPPNPHVGLMVEAYFESPSRSKAFLAPLCQKGAKNTLQITNTTFLSGRMPLPTDLAEQQKIAECLSSVDELMAAQSRKVDALKTHKKGLMQQLFPREGETQPRLRFPEFQNAGEWVPKRLEDISHSIFDGTHQTPTYTPKGVPFYSVENLISGNANKFISHADYLLATKKNRPENGDILITRIGKIGYSQVVTWDHEFSVYVTLAVIKKSKSFNSHFLSYFMQSDFYQSELRAKSLPNAVPPKINLDSLRSTGVLLTNEDEQQRIASCLSSLDALITAETQRLEAIKTHKKGLMQQLFPSMEVAEA